MPSTSKKQHNFMAAVAHNSAFAKKAGVPQSVGKDFNEADKGRKFSKGGDMAESKKMVGKEVAFMKKKGAPASMIKHEKAEMKGMKAGGKVRRYGAGGGPLGDESIMTDEEYAKQKEQGAKNLKSLKSFFGFGEKETPAPIDRSRDIEERKTRSLVKDPVKETVTKISGQKNPAETSQAETTRTEPSFTQRIADQMLDREKGGSNYGADYGSDYSDYGDNSGSSRQTFKPIGVETSEKKSRVITAPAKAKPQEQPAKAESTGKRRFSSDSPDLESRAEEMKPRRKFGLASDETRSAVRKRLGSALDFFDLSKAHEREFGKKMAKGGKVKKMAMGGFGEQLPGMVGIATKAMNANQEAQRTKGVGVGGIAPNALASGQPNALAPKVLASGQLNTQQPVPSPINRAPGTPGGPPGPVKSVYEMKNPKTGKLNTQADLTKQLADYKTKHGISYTQAMAKQAAAKKQQAFIANDKRARTGLTSNPEDLGPQRLSLPEMDRLEFLRTNYVGGDDYSAKKGGQVKKMAQGGFTREADGVATKGKTQGKVVKMASGGFVKNADGCAQRGKTKAFQVKMNRGGRC